MKLLVVALMLSGLNAFASDFKTCSNDKVLLQIGQNSDPATRDAGYPAQILILQKVGGVPLSIFSGIEQKEKATVYESKMFEFELVISSSGKGTVTMEGISQKVKCK